MTRNHLRTTLAALAASMAMLIAPALAGLPAIFDRVPAEATVVVVTQNLDTVDRAVSQLLIATELPALATPSELLRRIGMGEQVDMSRPMAIALMPGDLNADLPPAVAFIPTNNFADMMDALNATAEDDIYTFGVTTGETLYARQGADRYAIVGPIREIVAAVDGRGGNLAAHEAQIGAVGATISEKSNIVAVVKKPMLDLLEQRLTEEVNKGVAKAGEMGEGDADKLRAQADQASKFIKSLFNDATDLVIGATAGAMGLSFDTAMDFVPDNEFGQLFNAAGDSSRLLSNLPDQPFLFAFAGDYTAPAVRKAFDVFAAMNNKMVLDGAIGADVMKKMIDLVQGQAIGVFVSPGGLLGGLFSDTVSFTSATDPNALLNETRAAADQANAAIAQIDKGAISIDYQKDATQIDGVSVDKWSVSLKLDAPGQPGAGMAQQAIAMLFGPGGLGGYYAPGKSGVYQTMSPNDALLSAAMAAEAGQNSLTDNRMLSMVAKRLPDNRTFEAFVGVQSIVQQALGAMAIFGMKMDVDVPQQLPPVGVAGVTSGSAGRVVAFIPAPVIKTIAQIANQAQQMFGDHGPNEADQKNNAPPF